MKLVLNVKLPKVGSNAIVPVPVGVGPNQKYDTRFYIGPQPSANQIEDVVAHYINL